MKEETKLKGRLYIKEIEDDTISLPKKVNDFLQLYFIYKDNHNTNYGGRSTSLATYSNKECTISHCDRGRMRSFDDLYMIMKNYYPMTTVKGLFKRLLLFRPIVKNLTYSKPVINNKGEVTGYDKITEDIYLLPNFSNCCTMGRIKLTYFANLGALVPYKISYDSAIGNNKYQSVYSWKDLFSMLDINSQKDLDEYLKENLVKKEELVIT